VPTVSRINVAPVKALGLVHPDEVMLARTGVAENRRFHLIDERGRRYNQIRNGGLVRVRPEYDAERERLTLTFPDGEVADGEVALGEEITVDFYGRPVRGHVVHGPWAEALSRLVGRPLRLVQSAPGDAVDRGRGQISVVSVASLAALAAAAGRDDVDGRRFRMLFEIDGVEPHEEDTWLGTRVAIGDAVVVPLGDVGRCVVTTCDPDTAVSDLDTLKALAGYRREGVTEPLPFGVYCNVAVPGRVRVGDAVRPAQLAVPA
jgi:uncharacterized protein YcbX